MRLADLIPGASVTLPARITVKVVELCAGACGCHAWTGATAQKRDGVRRPKVRVGGRGSRVVLVARLVLVLKDRVPLWRRELERLEAGHTCGHFWCVNPEHLTWQTRIENEREKQERDDYEDFAAAVDELADWRRHADKNSSIDRVLSGANDGGASAR